jgi:tungstate transport system permease protein
VDVLLGGLLEAVRLLLTGDEDTWSITALTLRVSATATAVALLLGVPLGTALALGRFLGRRVLLAAANTGMGLPPVVVGLFVTVLLWRNGPLGAFGLLYTPTAMVIAQALIATPIVSALTAAALQQVDPDFLLQMRALGATRAWALRALLAEARLPLLAAALAGFGAVVSEVGAAQMVGGNIQGETRVLTTAAVLATSRGQFALAIAFGLVLLAIAFAINLFVTLAQQREARSSSSARSPSS